MRTGCLVNGKNKSMIPPRTANSPRFSTKSVRTYAKSVKCLIRSLNAISCPCSIDWSGCLAKSAMIRWITPLTGVITIGLSAEPECANSFSVWIRRATVSLRGLKRSCGKVSQAGNSRTRSCKSRSSLAISSAPRLEPLTTRTGLDWAIWAIKNGKLGGGVTRLWDRPRLLSLVTSANSGKSASEFNKPRMTTPAP